MLVGSRGKDRGSSLQEKTLHTYTFRLDQSRNFILYQKKKKKGKKRKEKANGKTLHDTIWEEHTLFIYLLIERKKKGWKSISFEFQGVRIIKKEQK